jgi:elongation factor Ts
MAVTTEQVRELRDKTGAGIMDSKRALVEADGDAAKATEILRLQGLARAGKKSDRSALQGLVEPYIHGGGRIGALVEINCETDFVARTPDFQALAHDVAMQVAAIPPRYVSVDEVPESEIPALVKEFGSKEEAVKLVVLLEQTFIKDAKKTIDDIVKEGIAKLGENIVIRRYSRFELGADLPDDSRNA